MESTGVSATPTGANSLKIKINQNQLINQSINEPSL